MKSEIVFPVHLCSSEEAQEKSHQRKLKASHCKRGREIVLQNVKGFDCNQLFQLCGFFLTDKFLIYAVEEPRFHLFQRI